MKNIILILTLFVVSKGFSQGIVLQGNATFKIGSSASFYAGPNTTFNGVVTNEGIIRSFSDLDFVANRDVGSLTFVGAGDQNLAGDTLDVVDIVVNKTGNSNVVLLTDQVVVSGALDVENGVIQAEDELDLLVSGSSNFDDTDQGYVEGKLVGLTSGQDVSFPMGLNGNPNYVTLSNVSVDDASAGAIIKVECQEPLTTIFTEEDVEDVSEDVEWILTSINGVSAVANLTINFSGVSLAATENIRATTREPAILVLIPGDSLFRRLATNTVSNLDIESVTTPPTSGRVVSSGTVSVGDQPIRLAVAWVPVIDGIEFFVPNSFSPNAMFEENRVFRPFFSGELVTRVSMTVYNNLNSEVYSISLSDADIDLSLIGWDGRLPSSGQTAPGGVYYYTVNLTSASGVQQKAGSVLLVE